MSDEQKVSAAKFFGGGGGRILLCALAMVCVTFLIYSKSFTSDYHMGGICIGFALLSGSVAGKDILAGIKMIVGSKTREGTDERDSGSDPK